MAMVGSMTRGEIMGTPGTKFEYTDSEKYVSTDKKSAEEQMEDPIEEAIDYTELIKSRAFLGDTPFSVILEGLETQFDDYINLEDKTNYVDIFYSQLHKSYESVKSDASEDHPNEVIEVLDNIHQTFISSICNMLYERLTLTIIDVEGESFNPDDLEFVLRRVYEFFILGARDNFKVVIAASVLPNVIDIIDDSVYFLKVQELVWMHNPLITSFGPMEFLKYRNDSEIIEMFNNGKIAGNFLRKYSPKFYQNGDFLVEVINHITIIQQFRTDLIDSVNNFENSTVSDEIKATVTEATDNYLRFIRESVCEDPDDTNPAVYEENNDESDESEQRVYEWGPNYENEYEIGPYDD